ncbi:MAG: DUF268 domain-containing protein [Sterolibacterium sp.]
MLEQYIRQHPRLLRWAYAVQRWLRPVREHPLAAIPAYIRLLADWRRYLAAGGQARLMDFYPCLSDRTAATKIDPHYFHQAVWALRQLYPKPPVEHVDIGSDSKLVGMLSVVTRVVFVDIRPLAVQLEHLECRAGTILDLPFADASVMSLSCLHVLEHIGLGRYGDPLDPQGSVKACRELVRVLAPGGRLYLSTPVGRSRVQFNGQRVFSVEQVLEHLQPLDLVELALVDPDGRFLSGLNPRQATDLACREGHLDFSLGCFVFSQPLG